MALKIHTYTSIKKRTKIKNSTSKKGKILQKPKRGKIRIKEI